MALLTIDHTHRGRRYRLSSPERSEGARVTYLSPTSMPLDCSVCGRSVKHGTRIVLWGISAAHPACAIRAGALVPIGDE